MSFVTQMLIFFFLSIVPISANEWPPATWTQPTEPFQIAGPIYYVGGRELTAYLLVDEAGLILVNVGMEENVPLVFASIEKLGFDPKKIRILLITQAHFDHGGGAALVQKQTGARVLAGLGDVPLLQSGGKGDYVFGDELPFTPVPKVEGLRHGQRVRLGGFVLETIATPGHTPGSSSWYLTLKETEVPLRVLFQGSISVLGDAVLKDNPVYPDVVDDFRRSFRRLESIRVDMVLPDHMVFAHPEGATHAHEPKPEWFKQREILTQQIDRSRRALEKKLQRKQ